MSYTLEQRKAEVRHYLETVWRCADDPEQGVLPGGSTTEPTPISSLPNTELFPGAADTPPQARPDSLCCPVRMRQLLQASLPDLHFTLLEVLVAEGETVVARWSIHGTDRGGYAGHLPTGRPVSLTGMTLLRLEGLKVIEDCCEANLAEMQRQLGFVALPAPRITIRQPGPQFPGMKDERYRDAGADLNTSRRKEG